MPGRSKQHYPYERRRVNEGSQHSTPASVAIDIHYAALMLDERWNWERYARLCQFLKMTPYELASLVRLPHKSVDRYMDENRMPEPIALPVALLLTLVEAQVCKSFTNDVIERPFPTSANL